MKKLAALLMVLALTVFTPMLAGCGGGDDSGGGGGDTSGESTE